MKSTEEVKAFANHCRNIAMELDDKIGQFERVCVETNGDVYCVLETFCDEDTYTIDITPYLETPLSELRAKRAEREQLEQEEIAKYEARQARLREELERKEYERLKAKFE
jgi:hypothetical protein